MDQMQDIQQRHETAVAKIALQSLGVSFSDIHPGIPGDEPDCMVEGNDNVAGIEVTDAYYSKGAAKATRDAVVSLPSAAPRLFFSGLIYEPDASIIEEVCQRIQAKEKKNYVTNKPVWLLVNMQAHMTDDEFLSDFADGLSRSYRPQKFARILLGKHQNDGSYRVWVIN